MSNQPTAKQRLIKVRAELRKLRTELGDDLWYGDRDRIEEAEESINNILQNWSTDAKRGR